MGGGIKTVAESRRQMKTLMPSKATWIKDEAVHFVPRRKELKTKRGAVCFQLDEIVQILYTFSYRNCRTIISF